MKPKPPSPVMLNTGRPGCGELHRHRIRQAEAEMRHAGIVEPGAHVVHRREVVAPERRVAAVEHRQRIVRHRCGDGGRQGRRGASTGSARRPSLPARPSYVARRSRSDGQPAVVDRDVLSRRARRCRSRSASPGVGLQADVVQRRRAERRRIDVDVDVPMRAPDQRPELVPHPAGVAASDAQHDVGLLDGGAAPLDRRSGRRGR